MDELRVQGSIDPVEASFTSRTAATPSSSG